MTRALVARLDNAGDVLLTGPAVRAVAARADHVTFVAGPRGRAAAELLPGVDEVVELPAPWIDAGVPVDGEALLDFVARTDADDAVILTSFHQTPLPLALLLRMAGVQRIAAVSEDHPGSLLDVRHRLDDDIHEVERNLSVAATLGYRLPPTDDGRLRIRRRPVDNPAGERGYVVVHPGASVPARAWDADRNAAAVGELLAAGFRVAVTGGTAETDLTAHVAGEPRPGVTDLGGRTDLHELAQVLADARTVVTGNTGPAHLAAAVGTPVVSLYAPTVPPVRWRPWGVPHLLLGDLGIACAGCRATTCPQPTHACLDVVSPSDVVDAVRRVTADRDVHLPWVVA